MTSKGYFDLQSASHLREKLQHDLAQLEEAPMDAYRAFNFFVTAEHILDWRLPGDANRAQRTAARKAETLLQIEVVGRFKTGA